MLKQLLNESKRGEHSPRRKDDASVTAHQECPQDIFTKKGPIHPSKAGLCAGVAWHVQHKLGREEENSPCDFLLQALSVLCIDVQQPTFPWPCFREFLACFLGLQRQHLSLSIQESLRLTPQKGPIHMWPSDFGLQLQPTPLTHPLTTEPPPLPGINPFFGCLRAGFVSCYLRLEID